MIQAGSGKFSGTSSPTPRGIRPLAVSSRSARGTSRRIPSQSNSRTKGAALMASQLDEIFEPFKQGIVDGAPSGPGLGLGLSIARWIIEAHGGTLVAESLGPGQGATFRIVLGTATTDQVLALDRPEAGSATALQPAASESSAPASPVGRQRSYWSKTIRIPCAPSRCPCLCSATRFAPRIAFARLWPRPWMEDTT